MPKVRPSSGIIGTICFPIILSFERIVNNRTNAIVVESSRLPVPSISSLKTDLSGTSIGVDRSVLIGSGPPSTSRRSCKYLYSVLPFSKR